MINRELIRLKVVQLSYAYYQNGSHQLATAENDLFTSLSKAYDLYLYMLELMVEITRIAERAYLTAIQRAERLGEAQRPNPRFVNNQFVAQLRVNHQLQDFRENQKKTWANDEDFVRRLYKSVTESQEYQEWMAKTDSPSYAEDRDFWEKHSGETLQALIRSGERAAAEPVPVLTLSDYLAYSQTGNRKDFEDKYFLRRQLLSDLVLAECAEHQGRFLAEIRDLLKNK